MLFQVFMVALLVGYLTLITFIVARLVLPSRTLHPISQNAPEVAPPRKDPTVALIDVHKSFDQPVIQGVSFKVQRGETLGILGRSGSGKSVTLQLIVGLLKPDLGYVVFEGKDLALMNERELLALRKRVSYVFQGGAVFDFLNVRENVAYPLREMGGMDEAMIQNRVQYLLQAVGMEDQGDLVNSELSIGAKKLVAVARAIANDPEVLLYDEPTTGLDPLTRKSLSHHIRKLNRQEHLTSIVVTHDLKCLEIVADRIILLKNGTIRFEGNQEEFHASSDLFVQAFIAGKRYEEEEEEAQVSDPRVPGSTFHVPRG
ncbi:MAG: ATP-binding cassette domain-containing protein [Acidobacteriota bacterium]